MTRINFEEKLPPRLDVPELKRPKKFRPKKMRLKTGCLLLGTILVIFFLFVITAAVAKTGIVEIPVFSQIFYRLPQPTRQVEIDNPAEFIQKSAKTSYDSQEKLFIIELTEEDLTFLIRRGLQNQKDPIFAQNSQAVITDGGIEFFGLLLKPVSVNLTIKIKIVLGKDSIYDYQVTQFKVGGLNLPPTLVNWAVHKYVEAKGSDYQKLAGIDLSKIKIDETKPKPAVEIKEGILILKIPMDLDNLNQTIQDNLNKTMTILNSLEVAEIEKIKNYDFDNLSQSTLDKLKEINITPEALKKLRDLKSN